jgi:hypothetical protein
MDEFIGLRGLLVNLFNPCAMVRGQRRESAAAVSELTPTANLPFNEYLGCRKLVVKKTEKYFSEVSRPGSSFLLQVEQVRHNRASHRDGTRFPSHSISGRHPKLTMILDDRPV